MTNDKHVSIALYDSHSISQVLSFFDRCDLWLSKTEAFAAVTIHCRLETQASPSAWLEEQRRHNLAIKRMRTLLCHRLDNIGHLKNVINFLAGEVSYLYYFSSNKIH